MSQNVWKAAFILFVIIQITQAWEMVCYSGSLSNFKRVTYTNATELITSGYYNINQKGVVYAHGYRGNLTKDTDGTNNITASLIQLFGINVCAVDWSEEANYGSIPFVNYPLVVAKAYEVQREVAEWLKIMWQNGMNPGTMHLIGFSLGAHVVGNAGRTFSKLTNKTIARVTGLDPAGPGYAGPHPLNERINRTSADFVDIIHTDTSRYGMATALGHVDCYPNLNEYKTTGVQPGCEPARLTFDKCSHLRGLELYIDSLKNKCQLLAAQAANETVWASRDFIPEVVACIGENINQTLRGNFYLATTGHSPYGLKETGLRASQK